MVLSLPRMCPLLSSLVGPNEQVDWHLSSGLAVVFIEAPEKMQESARMPQALYDQCDYWGLPTSGNVVGKNSTTDMDGQPWGPFPLVMVCPFFIPASNET
jgi:hypothetical protein